MRKALFILGQLSDGDVEWLAQHGERRRLADGETIVREGHALEALFITLDGRLRVTIGGGEEVAQLGAGEVVGEIAFVDSAPPLRDGQRDRRCGGAGAAEGGNPQATRRRRPICREVLPGAGHLSRRPPARDDPQTGMALVGFRGDGAPHLTRAAIRAPSRALPRRRALCTNSKKPR